MDLEKKMNEFEGDEVTGLTAYLPAARLEAPEAYQRGTVLTLKVEVRVRSVRLEEDRKGDLSRVHVLALENVAIIDSETPAERRALAEAQHQAALDAARQELIDAERRDAAYVSAANELYPPEEDTSNGDNWESEGGPTNEEDLFPNAGKDHPEIRGSIDEPIPYVLI